MIMGDRQFLPNGIEPVVSLWLETPWVSQTSCFVSLQACYQHVSMLKRRSISACRFVSRSGRGDVDGAGRHKARHPPRESSSFRCSKGSQHPEVHST